jgi:hypothetical protein
MTATPFTPRAGSIGQRAIEYLMNNGPTEAGKLADAIDAELGMLRSSLKLCLQHGLVMLEAGDIGAFYRLPEQAFKYPTFDPIDVTTIPQFLAQRSKPSEAITSKEKAQEIASAAYAATTRTARANPEQPTMGKGVRIDVSSMFYPPISSDSSAPASRHFEFGSFSDGRFVIEHGQHIITLTCEEADRLGKFVGEHGIGLPC